MNAPAQPDDLPHKKLKFAQRNKLTERDQNDALLREEPEPAVRVVLGHFAFVYVHPYVDGNGRIGRLLMNLMLTAAGYPWTIVPVERRDAYMTALEAASVGREIGPFTDFLAALVTDSRSMTLAEIQEEVNAVRAQRRRRR